MLPKQNQSTAEALLKKSKEQEEKQQKFKEEALELKKACEGVFSTPNGIVLARAMMRASGIYKLPKNISNPLEMAAQAGKEWMYLTFVKGVLSPEQLMKIERKD